MPDKFHPPSAPADALYHAVLCGHLEKVQTAIREAPELIRGRTVVDGAWSHGGRRCGAEDDVIECLWLLIQNGADFEGVGVGTIDSAFKTFPRAANVLLANGANANAVNDEGSTALHYMVEIGNRSAARRLLKHGADMNAKAAYGETPLDVAVRCNLPRMVHFLRENGAQSHVTNRDDDPFRPMETEVELGDGRWDGEVAWYRADRGYGYIRDQSMHSGELFFDVDSIVGELPDSIEEETDVSFEIAHDKFGLRAVQVEFGKVMHQLHAYCGDTEIVRRALAAGADPNWAHPTEGSTMLHNICYCRQKLRHPGREDNDLIRAGLWNDEPWMELIRLAIDAGADVNAKTNVDVKQDTAQPWRYHGETPLHLAAASWAPNLVKELLAAGADKSICNAKGETPYRWAVRYGSCQEIKTLLLPDGDRKDENQYHYQWYSDAWAAFFRADEDNCLAELKYAIELGLDPNDDSGPEGRPLMQCANFGQDELIEHLLSFGAEADYPSDSGSTPLHVAAMQGYTSTVKLLLAHGANPNSRTNNGYRGEAFTCPYRGETPLHFAAAYGDLDMVNAGADKHATDATGATVLDYYRRHRGENRDDTGLRSLLRGWNTVKKDENKGLS